MLKFESRAKWHMSAKASALFNVLIKTSICSKLHRVERIKSLHVADERSHSAKLAQCLLFVWISINLSVVVVFANCGGLYPLCMFLVRVCLSLT